LVSYSNLYRYTAALGITEQDQDAFVPQAGFEKWRGAPYWMHFTEMPVSFNREPARMKKEKLVVVGHTTERDATPLFMASIHKHGLAAAISGAGTWWGPLYESNPVDDPALETAWFHNPRTHIQVKTRFQTLRFHKCNLYRPTTRWHNFEDKNMGLKAAMLKLPEGEDPVVIYSDAADSMYTCDADEMLARFNALDADLVVGTETQCWPPDSNNCVMGQGVMEEGMAAGMEVISDEGRVPDLSGKLGSVDAYPRPRMWGNGGVIMGRRSKMMELVAQFEDFLVENPVIKAKRGKGTSWGAFYKSCKPYNMTDDEWQAAVTAEAPTTWMSFNDQLCLNRFMIEKAEQRDLRVKFDRDSTLMHTMVGGGGLCTS
jgi:hypothetical protein